MKSVPDWVRPAVKYLKDHGALDLDSFEPRQPLARSAFTRMMSKTFGGGYSRTKGDVLTGEVDAALVRALGKQSIADDLESIEAPDGWKPRTGKWFGTEIVAREMLLRHDHSTDEEELELLATDPVSQADAVYSVWKAKTAPSTWGADALESFSLPKLSDAQREVVEFAFAQVGTPYIWGGEWSDVTPSGYPYGAQPHGGFDCSGFSWYVLQRSSDSWSPRGRPYSGWKIPGRSSAQMAGATKKHLRFRELRAGDLLFFASGGRHASASSVYHAGVYVGHGWMIDSSGSQAGVSLSFIGTGSWYRDQFAWGRRVLR